MSGGHRRAAPRRPWWPAVATAAMAGRARADAGPLALTALVVAVAAFLAVVTPRLVAATGDDALPWAVRAAGHDADLTFARAIEEDAYQARALQVDLADESRDAATSLRGTLAPALADAVSTPVTSVATLPLLVVEPAVDVDAPVLRTAFVDHAGTPAVTWVAGRAPGPTLTEREARTWQPGPPVPVEVGLSEAVAAALGVGAGDVLATRNDSRTVALEAHVSGVFRADDPTDPAWSAVPGLLAPRAVGTTLTRQTQVAGLLSDTSLPAAVLAMPPSVTQRVVAFPPAVERLVQGDVAPVAAQVAGLRAQTGAVGADGGARTSVTTGLDRVLLDARARFGAAVAQASVLLGGVLSVALLTLLVAAGLLVRRRATTLATHRARGATLPAVAVELGTESALLTAAGAAAGVGAAALVAPGPVPWAWLLPVVVVAAAGPPVLGVRLAARSAGGRRVGTDRAARAAAARDRHAGRLAGEAAVVLLAVGALVALGARGVTDAAAGTVGAAPPAADALLALAPTLGVLAGGVLLLRVLPVLLRRAVAAAGRSRRAVPVLAAARAHDAARGGLAFLALTLAAGLVALGTTVVATVQRGEVDASWQAVGADATVTAAAPDAGLADVAGTLRASAGVDLAVPGRVDEHAQVFGPWGGQLVRVVALPAADYADLLARTPLPDDPALRDLGTADGRPAALLSPGLRTADDPAVELLWGTARVDLVTVGTAPALLAGDGDAVVVDADALAAAIGVPVVPDRVWVVGTGASAAVADAAGLDGTTVATRDAWLVEHRAEPLTVGVQRAATAATLALLVLVALVVVLAAATSAPQRGATLATLRTLGLGGRDARLVTLGELLPGALLAAAGGAALGGALTGAVVEPLALRLVTGQADDPAPVWSAWSAASLGVVAVTLAVTVLVESSLRRRERLGEVLRVGGSR
ncbi:FtsX-like permease family protein [Cellulomonas iranensis]|uniref:FtsX-like permease family protein n=1 Tax=Cellulomonas iranensis TaxID=76862 RepID=UPI000B3CB4B8|nr:FtsX-like permease family protein [Cellulomonas iranensis]